MERTEWAEWREGKKEGRQGKERAAAARPKCTLKMSCRSLSGVLEEQPEQSVLFCGPHESLFSSGLQETDKPKAETQLGNFL